MTEGLISAILKFQIKWTSKDLGYSKPMGESYRDSDEEGKGYCSVIISDGIYKLNLLKN